MDPELSDFDTFHSPVDDIESISNDGPQMDLVCDLQDAFEPLQRARSNTWPLPRPENFSEPDDNGSKDCNNQQLSSDGQPITQPNASAQKKNSSRRNAWGNLSYADLITQAINSAVDRRLTLSQIYEWMVQNVAYFKDKGDSNSSAGWKNSIRHNLSLHSRFMRVQNEGTGKSSWWMLNPDAKPGKSVRRRAASMEAAKLEKRRGRFKKNIENVKNGTIGSLSGMNEAASPRSSISEGLDRFPDSPLNSGGFQLSPDFRQRASSNASSIIDYDTWNYVPLPHCEDLDTSLGCNGLPSTDGSIPINQCSALDQLAGSLADELVIQSDFMQAFSPLVTQPPPPPYQSPTQTFTMNSTPLTQPYTVQQPQCPIHQTQPCTCTQSSTEQLVSPATCMASSYPNATLPLNIRAAFNSFRMSTTPTQNTIRTNTDRDSMIMGHVMGALNNQQSLEDLDMSIFGGGLECNIDELIQQEINIDGCLDIPTTQYTGSHCVPLPQNSE